MRSVKLMLCGIMLMLLAIFTVLVEAGRNSWLGGAAVILLILALIFFLAGAVMKK